MKNVVNIRDNESPDVEAGLWVSKIDRGLTDVEKTEFKAWVSIKENKQEFTFLAHLWDDMEDISRLSDLFPEEDLSELEHSDKGQFNQGFAIAASFMIALCVIGLGLKSYFEIPGYQKSYETVVGEQSKVGLPDGSVLTLNTNSFAKVSFTDNHRLLTLERGEIYIDVAHDTTRPLSVKVGNRVIQAVGTAFNIELLNNKKVELVVTDGKVRIGDRVPFEKKFQTSQKQKNEKIANKPFNVLSGQSLSVSKGEVMLLGQTGSETVAMSDGHIEALLSWHNGHLQFNGESLEEAIFEVSRYTSTTFEFENEDIKKVRIAGRFRAGDVAGLLLALQDTFQISSRKINDQRFSFYRAL